MEKLKTRNPQKQKENLKKKSAFLQERRAAVDGRIQRELEHSSECLPPCLASRLYDDDNILVRPYLLKSLRAYKKLRVALCMEPSGSDGNCLLNRLDNSIEFGGSNQPFCILAEHRRRMNAVSQLLPYATEDVRSQLGLMTVNFAVSTNLDQLEDAMSKAHDVLRRTIGTMNDRGHGVVIHGRLEPHYKSYKELTKPTLYWSKVAKREGIDIPSYGSWVLSGHYFVRCSDLEILRQELQNELPITYQKQIRIDQVGVNKYISEDIKDFFDYADKPEENFFDFGLRGNKALEHKDFVKFVEGVFFTIHDPEYRSREFCPNKAMVQYAIFMDRLGYEVTEFSCITNLAKLWLMPCMISVSAIDHTDINNHIIDELVVDPDMLPSDIIVDQNRPTPHYMTGLGSTKIEITDLMKVEPIPPTLAGLNHRYTEVVFH